MIDDNDDFEIIHVTEGAHADLGWYEAVCTKCGERSGNNAEPYTDEWAHAHVCAHAVPCVCTIDSRTGAIVDYDCGRVRSADQLRVMAEAGIITMPEARRRFGIGGEVDMVNHPPHYTSHPSGVECIDIARHLTGDWFNVFKYMFRADHKNGKQDIEKSKFYANDGLSHGIRTHASTWTNREDALIQRVIDVEQGSRKRFFVAMKLGARQNALAEIQNILDEWSES